MSQLIVFIRMFRRLIRAPIDFFDTNPVGKSIDLFKRSVIEV